MNYHPIIKNNIMYKYIMSDKNNEIKDLDCNEMKEILNSCKNDDKECKDLGKLFKEICNDNKDDKNDKNE